MHLTAMIRDTIQVWTLVPFRIMRMTRTPAFLPAGVLTVIAVKRVLRIKDGRQRFGCLHPPRDFERILNIRRLGELLPVLAMMLKGSLHVVDVITLQILKEHLHPFGRCFFPDKGIERELLFFPQFREPWRISVCHPHLE